ncbi:MAG: RluA family pseudouridine synthase [SAR202 cluster bacterium]|nr:RluA family pseudouridine synthase [SAR202 cluster bacterium]
MNEIKFVAQRDDIRLDQMISCVIETYSRSSARELIKKGLVKVDGKIGKPSTRVAVGQQIIANIPEYQKTSLQPQEIELTVIYEDESLIVIDKPAGLSVHPGPGHPDGTLINAVMALCPDITGVGEENRPGIVHRLDMDTSGVIVVAKNDRSHRYLSDQFKNRTVTKTYVALVEGNMYQKKAIIDGPIGRDRHDRKKMAIVENGRDAKTEYAVNERFAQFDCLDVKPKTGRTHQIRVHLCSLGHPVAGDILYGTKVAGLDRQFLHAASISLSHPIDDILMEFKSPLPQDLLKFKHSLS